MLLWLMEHAEQLQDTLAVIPILAAQTVLEDNILVVQHVSVTPMHLPGMALVVFQFHAQQTHLSAVADNQQV